MKLHFTNEWLRNQIEKDADIDCDAGIPLRDTTPIKRFVQSKTAEVIDAAPERKVAVLNVLVYQIRCRDKLTVAQLASRIRVNSAEIEAIEHDPNYVPRPRTMHMLAEYMKVSTQAVQSLTVDSIACKDNVAEEVLRFAATSKDLSTLTKSKRRDLNDFVKFLANYKGK